MVKVTYPAFDAVSLPPLLVVYVVVSSLLAITACEHDFATPRSYGIKQVAPILVKLTCFFYVYQPSTSLVGSFTRRIRLGRARALKY